MSINDAVPLHWRQIIVQIIPASFWVTFMCYKAAMIWSLSRTYLLDVMNDSEVMALFIVRKSSRSYYALHNKYIN